MNTKKSVVIIEDDEYVTQCLKDKLSAMEHFHCLATFVNPVEFLSSGVYPDIIILDIVMDKMNGLDAIEPILARQPEVYILINSIKDDTDTVFEAIKRGALGYIDKQTSDLNLERILNYAAADGAIMSPSIARKVFDYFKKPKSFLSELNETEKLITDQILEGNSYKMIASNLNVSIDVVRMHIKRIYKKLRINSKSQLFGLTRKQE